MENLEQLGVDFTVTEREPAREYDERIFTLADVKLLFFRERRRVFRLAILGALLTFGLCVCRMPKYRIEATFNEGAEKMAADKSLKELLGSVAVASSQPQAATFMKSFKVMRPLVEKLGLNAEIGSEGKKLSKFYRNVRDNFKAEFQNPLDDSNSFEFKDVFYQGNKAFQCWIRFKNSICFDLLDERKKIIGHGTVGKKVELPNVVFTLSNTSKNIICSRLYPLTIVSSNEIASKLKNSISIKNDKLNKSIYNLSVSIRDRKLGVRLLNELMSEYQIYLKKNHDEIASEQLAYLENRHNQMFSKMSAFFDEYAEYLKRSLEEKGFLNVKDESSSVLAPLYQMMSKIVSIDIEMARLNRLDAEERISAPADEGPFSHNLLQISKEVQELKQQRDLLELSIRKRQFTDGGDLKNKLDELKQIRQRREAAKEILFAFDGQKKMPEEFLFAPERSLLCWASRLEASRNEERADFSEYLDNHIRLLSVQEKMLQERLFHGENLVPELEGIDLSTARNLFVEYNNKLDKSQAAIRHFTQLHEEIDRKDFEIGSLSSVLNDPLSQKLIAAANQISMQLKDEKYHSAKEGERWEEELSLQRKILKDHLEQLLKVEEFNTSLIRDKIGGLQQTTLDCIHAQISVLKERASDAIKERKEALLQEKKILEEKIEKLRLKAGKELPERWRHEQWLNLKTEMGTKMMAALTELVESKTIGHHLHHIESKPLDVAILPSLPERPYLFAKTIFGAFSIGFASFVFRLFQTILKGFPSSFEKLKAMRYPILGKIGSHLDGPEVGEATGLDLELLRKISLFIETKPEGKTIALLAGKGPDYSYALAENLARRSIRSMILRCDFNSKFRAEDQPGILQIWKENGSELPIRSMNGYDVVTAGGFTPYGAEVVQSSLFFSLAEQLKNKYDVLILLFRSPLGMAESEAALRLCDKAVITVAGESTEQLTPFMNWAYHKGDGHLTFITVDS